MKKSLFILAAATLVLAGCEKNQPVEENKALSNQPQEIAFSSYAQTAKRVKSNAPVQSAIFPTTYTMEIAAYQSSDPTGNYFTKMTYKKDATAAYWRGWDASAGDYAPQYWPLSPATLNFFAISANNVVPTNITIANDLATASVAYTAANGFTATSQSDIMYAFNRGAVTQDGNTLHFNGDAPVNMVFSHALALINFQIKAADAASTAISIYKIELNGANYTGTLAFTNTNASHLSAGFSTELNWTGTAGADNVKVPNIGNETTPVALTTDYVPANTTAADAEGNAWAALMVVPTDQKAASPVSRGFTTFTIYYKYNNKDYTYTYAPGGYSGEPAAPVLTAVQPGKKYTYQITMTLHEITVAPSVTQWDEQNSENNVDIP